MGNRTNKVNAVIVAFQDASLPCLPPTRRVEGKENCTCLNRKQQTVLNTSNKTIAVLHRNKEEEWLEKTCEGGTDRKKKKSNQIKSNSTK